MTASAEARARLEAASREAAWRAQGGIGAVPWLSLNNERRSLYPACVRCSRCQGAGCAARFCNGRGWFGVGYFREQALQLAASGLIRARLGHVRER